MTPICHAVIWLDKSHRSNTYCMRDRGHKEEHSPNPDKKVSSPLTKDSN